MAVSTWRAKADAHKLAAWLLAKQEESGKPGRFLSGEDSKGNPVSCLFCGRFESHVTEIRKDGDGYESTCKGFEACN